MYLFFHEIWLPVFDLTVVVDFRISGKHACIEGLICLFSRRGAETAEKIVLFVRMPYHSIRAM